MSSLCILFNFPILCINPFPMHSSELGQESLKELNLNRVTRNSAIGQPLVDRRSVPSERTSEHVEARRNVSTSLDRPRGMNYDRAA